MYFAEDSGIYDKCLEIKESGFVGGPFRDLGIDWKFLAGTEYDFVAGGKKIIVSGFASKHWEDMIKTYVGLSNQISSNYHELVCRDTLPTLYRYTKNERHKSKVIALLDKNTAEQFRKVCSFLSKVKRLNDWVVGLSDTEDYRYGFLSIGKDLSLPEGSFSFTIIINTYLGFRDKTFEETLLTECCEKDHHVKIAGGLTKDSDGNWHSNT